MAVQFAQPYRFTEQQLSRMADAGIIPRGGTTLIDGVPYQGGVPVRFSSPDYYRLGEIGALTENERVELIDGEIIAMSPEGSRHSACIIRLIRFLTPRVGEALVGAHGSLFLPDEYRPMPDVVVLRASADEYEQAHPTHEDALVVIEVSDTSLRYDRHVKSGRYAQADIPEYWLVDLTRDKISVHQNPVAGEYAQVRTYGAGESWKSSALGGLEVAVDDVLKPR
ncbi:Uma2 family endonuclease [Longimicrobium sp.]|uniref:Uma2 family endonuclease n=1 Tax=Longimicrobium sp. TaxID=2029185 RepID=UPI003B3A6953